MSNKITKEDILQYGGVVLIGDLPETFPFSSEEVFCQVARGNMLRIEEGIFCWKSSPFEMKGYVGRLGKIEKKKYDQNLQPVMEILEGQTIDIHVYELRGSKIETHLRVLHERTPSGETLGRYSVEFEFNNGGGANYRVIYEDGSKTSYSITQEKLELSTSCSCFGRTRKSKSKVGGLECQGPVPINFVIEGFQE